VCCTNSARGMRARKVSTGQGCGRLGSVASAAFRSGEKLFTVPTAKRCGPPFDVGQSAAWQRESNRHSARTRVVRVVRDEGVAEPSENRIVTGTEPPWEMSAFESFPRRPMAERSLAHDSLRMSHPIAGSFPGPAPWLEDLLGETLVIAICSRPPLQPTTRPRPDAAPARFAEALKTKSSRNVSFHLEMMSARSGYHLL